MFVNILCKHHLDDIYRSTWSIKPQSLKCFLFSGKANTFEANSVKCQTFIEVGEIFISNLEKF